MEDNEIAQLIEERVAAALSAAKPVEYSKVTAVMGTPDMNAMLGRGWQIITSQFCDASTFENVGPGNPGHRVVRYLPYTLMGLPRTVAEVLTVEALTEVPAATPVATQEQVIPAVVTKPVVNDPQTPIATKAPPPPAFAGGQGTSARVAAALTSPADPNKSEETIVGVRRS